MKRRSRGWIVAIAVVFIAIFAIWWIANNNKKSSEGINKLKPTLSIAGMSINNIDEKKIDVNAKMMLSNPLPMELKTSRLDYKLMINGTPVVESSYDKPITIKSNDSSLIEMPMEVLAKPLAMELDKIKEQKSDSAEYTLAATMHVDVPIAGERSFNFNQTKKLPAFILPTVKIEDVDVKKLKLKESSFKAALIIENENSYPLVLKDAVYDVTVGTDLKMDGKIPGVTNIPAKSKATVPIHLDIERQKLGKLAWSALFEKKETPFTVNFGCKVVSKNEMFNNSTIAMHTNGTLSDLQQAVKNVKGKK
jgi:LEA14-like dessication related protein